MNEKRHCPYCNYDLTNTPRLPKIAILSQDDVYPLVNEVRHRSQEHFVTITIDSASNVIEKRIVFIGTLNECTVHPREIFAPAIEDRANGIIMVHNHPAGIPSPSAEDIKITNRLVEVGKLVGIEIVDHIIISPDGDFSFQKHELLQKGG